MAKTYTYEDFEKAMREAGMDGQFSTADLALAKRNPDAGMSLLNYKNDYRNATTDEMRALANSGAESIRKQYGEYSGGVDGSGFYLEPPSPGSFTSGTAPTFQDNYADDLEALLMQNAQREAYSFDQDKPVYESQYGDTIAGMLDGIINREAFSYDHTTDPVYGAYKKQYTREGKRATADALGEAASATGGMPSSYAVTAASQAGDYYASQLADKIPELYDMAYNRYLQEYQMKLSDLNAVQRQEETEYGRYLDDLGQYNTDRNFDYAKWLDEYDMQRDQIDTLRGLRNDEFGIYQTELGQFNTDRNFDYAQLLDEIDSQTMERSEEYQREQDEYDRAWDEDERAYQRAQDAYDRQVDEENRALSRAKSARAEELDLAELAAQFGDYDALRALGIDVDEEAVKKKTASSASDTWKQDSELAELAAKYGDYSFLQALGITPDESYVPAEESPLSAGGAAGDEDTVSNSFTEADDNATYQEAEMTCRIMAQNGASKAQIQAMLEEARNMGVANGGISGRTYRELYDRYVRGVHVASTR